MNLILLGACIGLMAAAGVLLMVFSAPPMHRMTLSERIAPYLADAPQPSRLLAGKSSGHGEKSLIWRITAPLMKDLVGWLDRLVGGQGSVRTRLAALNSELTVEGFRSEQILWGAIGLLTGVGFGGLAVLAGGANALGVGLLVIGCAVTGVLARDYWLTREVQKLDADILAEFPVVAEMLALAVTAGEGPIGAIERISKLAKGPLIDQLSAILADTRSGTPLLESITAVRDRTRLEPLARFLDGMAVAIERGTPLADVLRAQAADVRAMGKRQLMEAGGRKEIAMMVPGITQP